MQKIKKILKYRPFLWIYVLYKFEKNDLERKKQQLKNKENDLKYLRFQNWFRDNGDKTLRLEYLLNDNSLVFDVGGFKGDFTSAIHNMYNCFVYVFEPVPEFYNEIVEKFSKNKKIVKHNFGLSTKTKKENITLLDNGSSLYLSTGKKITIQLKSILEFLDENQIEEVNLIKINIEGGEFDLLESLIENDKIGIFDNIQVQFHDFIPHAESRMRKIQDELSKTHYLTYQYEFVWENWKRK